MEELQRRQGVNVELQKAIDTLPDPQEEAAGIQNTYFFSRALGVSQTEALHLREEIAKELTGNDKTTQKTFWNRLVDTVKAGAKSGHSGLQAGLIQEKLYEEAFQLSLEALAGKWNRERYNTIADLQKQITALAPGEKTDFLNQVVWDVGQIVPGMLGGMREGALYGLGTGLTAAIAGTTVPGVGTATAAGGGFLFGFGAGMASHSFRQMRGSSWLTLSQIRDDEGNPIPQSIVQLISFGAGALNAAIEVGQMGTLIKTVPGAKQLLEKSVGNAFDEVVKNGTLRSKILERLAEFGKYWTTEVGEELLQEIVDIISEHVAMDLATITTPRVSGREVRAPVFEHATVLEDYKRLAYTFIHTAPAMAILGAPGNVMGTIQEVAAFKRDHAETIRAESALQGIDLTDKQVDAQVDDELLRTLSEGLRIETPAAEVKELSPLARRLAAAPEERIAPPPVNERLELAGEIKDVAEKERVISGDIPLQEILEEEGRPGKARLSAEESLQEDARQFKTSGEFIEYVKTMHLTPADIAAIGNETVLDMRLRDYWREVQEPEAAPEAPGKAEVIPTMAQSEALFLDWYNTPESLAEPLQRMWFASKEKKVKGISPIIWGAANRVGYGETITDAQWKRIRKMLENNPHKYRALFAELTEDIDELRLMDQQVRMEEEAGKAAPAAPIAPEQVKMIEEERALAYAMQKAKQAARKSYYEGKRVGVATERARKAGLIHVQREKHKLRVYVNKLAAQIAKKPGKSIDFFYREAIENLQTGIDPHFRRRDTLESRERTRAFIERRPEAKEFIPKKVLTILEKKSLNELTVAELETLRNEIDILRKIGRTKKQLTWIGNERDYTGRRDDLLSTVMKGEKLVIEVKPVVKATMERGIIKKGYRFFRAFTLRGPRLFDKFDGGQNFKGPFHQVFYNEVNEKENGKIRAMDGRLEAGEAQHKKFKVSLADLARKKTTVDGVDYTLDEALDVYAGMKNESKTLAIFYGNNIDPKIAEQIITSLTPEEKALADYIIEDYEKRYEPLRNAHIAFMDQDLGHEENYTPIRRTDIEYQAMNEELRDELLRKTHLKKGYAEKGFTVSRQEIPPEFQKPIRLGLYATWLDQVPKQENYIAYAEKVRELHRLLNDKQLSAAIKQKYGDEHYQAARHYVDRVANPNIYRSFDKFERVSRALRKHTAIAYLAYNLVTIAKQLPSVFFYLGDVGPGRLIASTLEFAFHPFKTIEFVHERDPQMKHRSIEREMEELKRYDAAAFERIIKAVGKPGMVGIYAMDKIAVTIGWKAVYEANIKRGLSEAEAIREAQNVTLRTQPAARPKDIAELYATNEVLNWFTQFTNQLNQIYNIATYDIPQDFKNHRYYRGMLQVFGLGLSALTIWAISHRRLPEKPEDFADAGKDTALNMIPLIGRVLAAKDEGYSMGGPAPIEGITDLVTLYKSADWARKPVTDWFTDRRFRKSMDKALEAIAVIFGIPYIGPKRVIKAIEKGAPEELIGGKPK